MYQLIDVPIKDTYKKYIISTANIIPLSIFGEGHSKLSSCRNEDWVRPRLNTNQLIDNRYIKLIH